MTNLKSNTIICFSGVVFDKKPFTNRQRVMLTLSKSGHRILFVEHPKNPFIQIAKVIFKREKINIIYSWFKRIGRTERRRSNLLITSNIKFFSIKRKKVRQMTNSFNVIFLNHIIKKNNIKNPILWIYSPDAVDFVDKIEHSLVIYDCVDEYSEQPWYRDNFNMIKEDEKLLLSKADIVFTSSEPLYNEKRKSNQNVYLLENVADFDHFYQAQTNKIDINAEIVNLKNKPIIGFIGAIDAYKLDINLVQYLAAMKKNWNIVLIGPKGVSDREPDLSKLKSQKNVKLLGPKKYEDLPSYIKGFDVCIIPYNSNKYTNGVFPLKFFEFFAAGKPVVSIGLPSLNKYKNYGCVTNSYDEFINKIDYFLNHDSIEEINKRTMLANKNTWHSKVKKMEKIIKSFDV